MTVNAHPLSWPVNRPRTRFTDQARFRTTFAAARDRIIHEIELLGGTQTIISTNIPLRQDGIPYANYRVPEDKAVAVYFTYKGGQMCFACDRWSRVEDNMQAVAKTIEALRGVARWGTGDMMEAAFTGVKSLPAPGQTGGRSWREILGVDDDVNDFNEVRSSFRRLAWTAHPDRGGSEEQMSELNTAFAQARDALT